MPVAAGAQETSLPADVIAQVGSTPISRDAFVHWMNVANASSGTEQPMPALGSKDFQRLTTQAVQLLVSFVWIDGEAKLRGVSVTDAQVRHSFLDQKRQSFPRESDYQKFLAHERPDRGRHHAARAAGPALEQDPRQGDQGQGHRHRDPDRGLLQQHKARFAQPERRDLEVVLTKDKATAQKAYDALKGGASWKSVAKKYSIDNTSKNNGGKVPAQAKGTLDKPLDTAVFSAAKGELVGPIKTRYGYYVFTVTGITRRASRRWRRRGPRSSRCSSRRTSRRR